MAKSKTIHLLNHILLKNIVLTYIPNICCTGIVIFSFIASMQIFVKLLPGERITLQVETFDTIQNVKKKIQEQKGFPPAEQHLVYDSKQLNDEQTLADYHIQNDATFTLVLRREKKFFVNMFTIEMH